jgi:putative endonuclease
MFYVYILRSLKDKKRYIGMTGDLERRFNEHNAGLVESTKNRRPLEIIYTEEFETKIEAAEREHFFKTGKGREYLINNGI